MGFDLNKFLNFVKRHAHHFIFTVSILSLASLVAWWSVFIHNSITQQRANRFEILRSDLKYFSLRLGFDEQKPPPAGVWKADERFEVITCDSASDLLSERLAPYWPDFCLRVRPDVIQKIEKKSSRLNFMLIGEASVLILVILISSAFLYRYIQLERRTAREVREFWERTAHEIKTPITGIKAFLQNLKSGSCEPGEMAPYLDMALKKIHRQEQLAENILSGYSLRSKESKLRLAAMDLTSFLVEYFRKDALHLADAAVNLDFDRGLKLKVWADRQGLKVILDNITDNAVRYTSPGLVLSVEVSAGRKKAVVALRDNGPGFDPRLQENLFRAYKHLQDELPRGKHGAGIGLYISRQLARHMGGDLKAVSGGEGRGAEFRIFLNLVKDDEV